jgi:uncharacterized repeat protein (TIGR03899 family)
MTNPLVNLDNLTEPFTKLIEVVSAGMGTLYAPFGTVRQAKADAKAKVILAKADTEILSLQQRAVHRLQYTESRRQANLERIAVEASQALPNVVSGEAVDEDWILQFFENAQDVCDAEMQKLWGRLLAGEVASPGGYSKRTLQFLKTMSKDEALAFVKYCGFAFANSRGWHFVLGCEFIWKEMAKIFENIDFKLHFANIGLITPDQTYFSYSLNNETITYFGKEYTIKAPKPEDGLGKIYGHSSFTQIGQELRGVVDAQMIPNYVEQLSQQLSDELNIVFIPNVEAAD